MKDQLIGLVNLHRLDVEVLGLRNAREEIEDRIREVREALQLLQGDLDRQKEQLEETALLRRAQEAELRVKEDLIGRAKAKMAAVKNTREYMAAEREVESARRDSAMVEEQVLDLLKTEEKGLADLGERQERLDSLTAEVDEKTRSLQADIESLDGKLATASTGRDDLVAVIDRQLLARYNLISKKLGSAALSAANDDGTCASCNMKILPQIYNTLYRAESLHMCAHCKRILYLESWVAKDEPAAESPEPAAESPPETDNPSSSAEA